MTYDEFVSAITSSNNTYSLKDVSEFAQQLGIEMGRNELCVWLREHGYLCSTSGDHNAPTQTSMDAEYTKRIIDFECTDGKLRNVTRVTGKGLIKILLHLLEEFKVAPLVEVE